MEQYILCLEEECKCLKMEMQALRCQCRKDESNLVKIRTNILDVCKTICQVVWRTEQEEKRAAVYTKKWMDCALPGRVPKRWRRNMRTPTRR